MKFRQTERVDDLEQIEALDRECFPSDEPYPIGEGARWWAAREGDALVGYAGAKLLREERTVFLCRAGVAPEARGRGIQRRMIAVRCAWAKRIGAEQVVTYTVLANPASSNNLIRLGFRLYEPEESWAGKNAVYWMKELR